MAMLNARWLETFTTLCQTRHFTRTADLLGMTQPGVSQHLRKLEEQIGQPLISRQGKSFALTPAGEAVLSVGQTRRHEEQMLREAIQTDAPDVGTVSIGCSGGFAMLLYPQILPLMQEAPRLSVRLEATPGDAILQGVLSRRFDLGIVERQPDHPRLDAVYLGEEPLCLLLPHTDTAEQIRFGDLEERGFIAHPDGFAYADELFSLNFPEEFRGSDRLHVRAFINQISQIPAAVAQGIGYTLLPRSGVDAFPLRHKVRIVPLPRIRRHGLWLIHELGRRMPSRLSGMMTVMKAVARTLAPTS